MFETIELEGQRGHRFSIVLPREKGPFAAAVAEFYRVDRRYHRVPHVGVLALDFLGGAGSLVDVGANIGLVSIAAAVHGSPVVAVEMLPENCLCLSLAVLHNR